MATSSLALHTASETTTEILGLGTLVKLPREIRDEIYRYLVKGIYHINDPSIWIPGTMRIIIRNLLKESEKGDLDPNTLLLSKGINHEAAAVHYSESTFICYLDYSKNIVCLLQVPIDRMMKIELKVYSGLQAILERLGKPDSEIYQVSHRDLGDYHQKNSIARISSARLFTSNSISIPRMYFKRSQAKCCTI